MFRYYLVIDDITVLNQHPSHSPESDDERNPCRMLISPIHKPTGEVLWTSNMFYTSLCPSMQSTRPNNRLSLCSLSQDRTLDSCR